VNVSYVPASEASSGPLSSDSHIRGFWGYLDSFRAVDGPRGLFKAVTDKLNVMVQIRVSHCFNARGHDNMTDRESVSLRN
jgi:hypothetical protein